jgi:hypothetical protein
MCAGALVGSPSGHTSLRRRDLRFGGVRSKFRLADSDLLNHRLEIVEGVLAAIPCGCCRISSRCDGDDLTHRDRVDFCLMCDIRRNVRLPGAAMIAIGRSPPGCTVDTHGIS